MELYENLEQVLEGSEGGVRDNWLCRVELCHKVAGLVQEVYSLAYGLFDVGMNEPAEKMWRTAVSVHSNVTGLNLVDDSSDQKQFLYCALNCLDRLESQLLLACWEDRYLAHTGKNLWTNIRFLRALLVKFGREL